MTITPLGTVSVGAAVPSLAANTQIGVSVITSALPDLEARVASYAALPPVPVLDYAASEALAAQIVAAFAAAKVAIPPLPPPPSIASQLAIVLAELNFTTGVFNAHLGTLNAAQALLASGAIELYAFNGARANFGAELAGVVGSSGNAQALVLVATDAATWSAMTQTFKVS